MIHIQWKEESQAGLEQHQGEQMPAEFSFLGELVLKFQIVPCPSAIFGRTQAPCDLNLLLRCLMLNLSLKYEANKERLF